jgi:bacillithiol system protein YtxJ
MNWQILTSEQQLASIVQQSFTRPQVIFKHSTRCNISSTAKNRLEKSGTPEQIDFHFLDLLAHRSLSNKIADDLNVHHESPQVLLLKNGECVYEESHLAIYMDDIVEQVA